MNVSLLFALLLQSPDADYQRGLERLREGRHLEARQHLEIAARAAPGKAEIWKALGMAGAGSRDLSLAATAFGKACDLDTQDAESCYYQGRSLTSLSRYDDARVALEKAAKRAAPELKSRVERALALNFLGLLQMDSAEQHFREAVRVYADDHKTSEDPRIDYGAFLVRQGRAGEAIPLLERAVKSHPDSARAHAELGKAFLDDNRAAAAVAYLERSVALDPKAWTVRMVLGRAYLRLGRVADAEREMREGKKGWAGK